MNKLSISVFIICILAERALAINITEEYFTLHIQSSAENMTTHLNKDIWIEDNNLVINSAPSIGDVSVYSSFNIHAIDKGTHNISIGRRSNGLIEALLCVKYDDLTI